MNYEKSIEQDLENLGQLMKPDADFVSRVMDRIDAAPAKPSRMSMGGWTIFAAASLVACLLLAFGSTYFSRETQHPQTNKIPQMVRTSTEWQTVSERPVNLGGELPAREVNRQLFERIKLTNPQTHSTFEQIVPKEKATLITLENY